MRLMGDVVESKIGRLLLRQTLAQIPTARAPAHQIRFDRRSTRYQQERLSLCPLLGLSSGLAVASRRSWFYARDIATRQGAR